MNGGNEGMEIFFFFLIDENKFDWQDKVKNNLEFLNKKKNTEVCSE